MKKLLYQLVGWLALLATIVCWAAAALILISQLNTWLRYAYWPSQQTAAEQLAHWGVTIPFLSKWLGVQKIIDGVLAWPAAVFDFLLGLVFGAVMGWAFNKADSAQQEANRTSSLG